MSFFRIKICMGKLQFLHQPRLQGAARFHSVSALEEYKYACIVSVVKAVLFNLFVWYTPRNFMYKCHNYTDSCADRIRTTMSVILKFVMTFAITRWKCILYPSDGEVLIVQQWWYAKRNRRYWTVQTGFQIHSVMTVIFNESTKIIGG